MLAGLLSITAALAGDPTGARPGAGTPELVWTPVLQLRAGLEADGIGDVAVPLVWTTRGRVGLQIQRKVLTARMSVAAGTELAGSGAFGATLRSTSLAPGEAWVRGALPLSSAIGVDLTAGLQPVEVDNGAILGDDDERLDAEFPAALRLHLRLVPWDVDWISGAHLTAGRGTPFHALRVGAGRDNPVWAWHLSGLGLLVDPGGSAPRPDRPVSATFGLHGDTSLNRLRLRADGFVQPTDAGAAWLAGGDLGYALGDDGRVELAVRVDSLSGGTAPEFLRPFADTHARFGWVGSFDDGAELSGRGVLDAALVTTAIISPQLRFSGAAHHFWAGNGDALGPELDADLKWYWSPLAALHLRGGAYSPWSNPEAVRIDTAATIDVTL